MRSIETRLVQPFYLQMMGVSAIGHYAELSDRIIKVGRRTRTDEVVRLLNLGWREQVMGAWFALFHDDQAISTQVLNALEASYGTLTAPPLAVVAVTLVGKQSLDALTTYALRDVEGGFGSCAFVAAAIEHLGSEVVCCSATQESRDDFHRLFAVAGDLRRQAY